MERIKSKENHVKEVMEQKFSQIDGVRGSIEGNWGNVKETLLDILNNNIGKMEIAPRKPRITEAMVKKMEERRIAKTKNVKEYRRLNNQLRRKTGRVKEIYMEGICDKIQDLQRKGKHDFMYHKAQQFIIRTYGITDY